MKPILSLALLALLCAPASGQTLKALSYNTTNGQVAYTGTNVLTFTNDVRFDIITAIALDWDNNTVFEIETATFFVAPQWDSTTLAATTRTNLGLYNTNAPAAFAALALWDEVNDVVGLRVSDDEIALSPLLITTNAPTDTTNAVRWITVFEGTNSYRIPLFQ